MVSSHDHEANPPGWDSFGRRKMDYLNQNHRCFVLINFVICITLAMFKLDIEVGSFRGDKASSTKDYRNVSKYLASPRNEFVRTLKESLYNESSIVGRFTPLVITDDGRFLCRSLVRKTSFNRRTAQFSDMIRSGLPQNYKRFISKYSNGMSGRLPLLLIVGDGTDCDITKHIDNTDFPRLTWSVPSDTHQGEDWCHDIGMPSYEIWKLFGKTYESASVWDKTFQKNDKVYPWTKKVSKAVWRGSTTYESKQYYDVPFHDIPRAKLVQASIDHPDVIDAAFTKINQMFENRSKELASVTILTGRIPFDDQMKYKGEY